MSHSVVSHICIVPAPTSATIISDPVSPIRPVGSHVNLTCTVELSLAVDVPVTVNAAWTGPDWLTTINTARPFMGSITTYTSRIMVNSFRRNQSGPYTCRATVSSTSPLLINSSLKSGTANITVGKSAFEHIEYPSTNLLPYHALPGVYLFHQGRVINSNNSIFITDIGTSSPQQLVCTSDRMPCCHYPSLHGEWYFPDGSQVKYVYSAPNPKTFHRNRDNNGNVNLFRVSSDVMFPTGRFCCEIEDATNTDQALCVNVCE